MSRQRTLAGATILQIVPSLRNDPAGHAAIDTALALLQSGARAIVASDGGPLVGELRAFGGEWLPLVNDTLNPLRLRRNARMLRQYLPAERVDIVHAQSPGAARSARMAIGKMPVWLVTSFPDRLEPQHWLGDRHASALARGHRIIAPSSFISHAVIERYGIPPERITVIPRSVDTSVFDPRLVSRETIEEQRRAWGVLPGTRVIVIPGRISPDAGQTTVVDAARILAANNLRNLTFVFAGEDRERRYKDALMNHAERQGVDTLFRFVGPPRDLPGAFAAADLVVVPALTPPLTGRAVTQAQAMGRTVVTTAVGMLPENVLFPPRMSEELRTGWVVRPGHAGELARGIASALAMNRMEFEALGARARQFAEFAFSPQSVAEAVRGAYTSLLARDT